MAIQWLEQAANEVLQPAPKLVLMAIADDANRETRIAYPGAKKMAVWADCGEDRVTDILRELICRQLIARRSKAYRGRRAEYIVFPTPEEFEALDAKDATLNHVSQRVIDRVKKQDAKRLEAQAEADETTSDQPVDNVEESPVRTPPFSEESPVHDPLMPGVQTHPSRDLPPVTTQQSSTEGHHSAPVDNAKEPTVIVPAPKPQTFRPLDLIAVTTSTARLLAPTGITERGIADLAAEILSHAATIVLDPTAYVIGTIRRDGHEWQARAFKIAADETIGNVR